MVAIGLSAGAVARIRFAVSCLWEVVAAVRVLRDPGSHAVHLPWVRRVSAPSDTLLWALVPREPAYLPDFLTPPPPGLTAGLGAELARLRATPAAVVRDQLELYGHRARALRDLHADPAAGLARRTGMTAGGVSQHLTALRAAGLVAAHRHGRSVLNVRTALAEALLSSAR